MSPECYLILTPMQSPHPRQLAVGETEALGRPGALARPQSSAEVGFGVGAPPPGGPSASRAPGNSPSGPRGLGPLPSRRGCEGAGSGERAGPGARPSPGEGPTATRVGRRLSAGLGAGARAQGSASPCSARARSGCGASRCRASRCGPARAARAPAAAAGGEWGRACSEARGAGLRVRGARAGGSLRVRGASDREMGIRMTSFITLSYTCTNVQRATTKGVAVQSLSCLTPFLRRVNSVCCIYPETVYV